MALIWPTLIAIAAYFAKNEVMDPLRAFRAVRWKTATVLVIHEDYLANGVPSGEAKGDVRRLAAELRAAYQQIPVRGQLAVCRVVLAPAVVDQAVSTLIGLSNTDNGEQNRARIASIRGGLKLTGRPARVSRRVPRASGS